MFHHFHAKTIIQKVYLHLENLEQLSNLDIDFLHVFGAEWYLVQLIVLLKPDFNCCNNFALS